MDEIEVATANGKTCEECGIEIGGKPPGVPRCCEDCRDDCEIHEWCEAWWNEDLRQKR